MEGPNKPAEHANSATTSHAQLIRIAERDAMNRAVMVLGEVPASYCGFADSQLLVTRAHIAALQEAGIPYETLS